MSEIALQQTLRHLLSARRHEWPRRAFEDVVAGLQSDSRETRTLALRLAPRDVYDAVARELLALLGQRGADDAERLAVIDAMGGMIGRAAAFDFDVPCNPGAASKDRFESLLRALRQLFHDPDVAPPLRLRALEVGARAGLSWARGGARVAWRTDDPAWRRAAARAFAWLDGFDAEVAQAVADDDPVVRILGWRAAAERQLARLSEASLATALNASLPGEERAAALVAVGALAPAGAAEALSRMAEPLDPELQQACDDALSQLELESDQ